MLQVLLSIDLIMFSFKRFIISMIPRQQIDGVMIKIQFAMKRYRDKTREEKSKCSLKK